MQGKTLLMAGVAAVALVASSDAGLAKTKHHTTPAATSSSDAATPAASNGPSNAELADRLSALEAELAADHEHQSSDHTRLSTLEQSFNDVVWTFDNGRPTIKSGDGRFTMSLRARFQTDFAGFMQHTAHSPADLSSGAVLRRAYFGVEGTAYHDFAYEIRLNAGGSDGGNAGASGVPNAGEGDPLLNKAQVTYTGLNHWHFSVGVLEPALMFEGTTSSASLIFLERPEIDNIAADSFGAGDSRRGIEVGWQMTDALWAGDNINITAAFTGGKTGSTAGHGNGGDEQAQVLGRISDRVWTDGARSNIAVAVSGGYVPYTGSIANGATAQFFDFRDRPEIRVDGTRLIDTTKIAAKTGHMIALDLGGNWENFFLGGEWAQFTMDRQCGVGSGIASCVSALSVADHPNFSGWYAEASWILTGETKSYSASAINNEAGGFQAPVPSRPFSFSGDSWGAWELAVRYSDTDLNWHQPQTALFGVHLAGIPGGDERIIAVALNWYLNRNVRLMLDDNIVTLQKGTAAVHNSLGQNVNIVGVRLQFAN